MDVKVDKDRLEDLCRRNGIEFLGVFGSVARGEDKSDSDVDVLVRFDKRKRVTFIDLEEVEGDFEVFFNRPVDLVTTGAVSPFMRERVYKDMRVIYGKI